MLQSDKMVGKRRGAHVRSPSLLENTIVSLATYMWIYKSYSADIRGLGTSQKGIPNCYRSKAEHLQCHSAAAGLVNQLFLPREGRCTVGVIHMHLKSQDGFLRWMRGRTRKEKKPKGRLLREGRFHWGSSLFHPGKHCENRKEPVLLEPMPQESQAQYKWEWKT